MPLKIAYVVMKYPALSQTFIAREMAGLAAQGLEIEVHPCLDFRAGEEQPGVVRAGSWPKVVMQGLIGAVREIGRRPSLLWRGLRLLWRYPARSAEGWFMTFWGALFAFARVDVFRRDGVNVIHGAWATAPATAAMVLGELCNAPFSFGAHAYDLHRHGGDPLLAPKLERARFVHTTTQANVESLRARFPGRRAEIVLARRGLASLPALRESRPAGDTLHILSVGRLVEKKGHLHQIAACRELARRGVPFHLKIIGEGPLRAKIETAIADAGLGNSITLEGALAQPEVEAAYANWADVFWHTGIVDAQGDRDGLPNVIPEALSHGLPVISSAAGGAAEAIHDGETGLLADPPDSQALADAVTRLAGDPALRNHLGANGRRWVEQNFLVEINTRLLAGAFRAAARRAHAT
jgi:glycosyltransferase involved in cell wall biosynthesis